MSAATTKKPETLTAVPIPADFGAALVAALGREGAERWALETLVLHGMDAAGLTTGEAGELLGVGYHDVLRLLKERHVPLVLTEEEREADRADLRRMFADLFPSEFVKP